MALLLNILWCQNTRVPIANDILDFDVSKFRTLNEKFRKYTAIHVSF